MSSTEAPPRCSLRNGSGTLRKFGDNVRTRREAQDLSQKQLAERADLDRTYISVHLVQM